MKINQKEPIILILGDIFFLYLSLFIMLFVINLGSPGSGEIADHLAPFSIIFIVWLIVFFIAGLYDKHTSLLRERLPNIILNTQITNSFLAVLFFYLIPYFGITPKTNLFIYLLVSFFLLVFWRVYLFEKIKVSEKRKALLIGSGEDMEELKKEVNSNSRYGIHFKDTVDLSEEKGVFLIDVLKKKFSENNFSVVVVDLDNPKIQTIFPELYILFKNKIEIIDGGRFYEEVFDRVPVKVTNYRWFVDNISLSPNPAYDLFKRLIDLLLSILAGIPSLILVLLSMPFIKIDSKGKIFIKQERIGKDNKVFEILKLRTMEKVDSGEEAAKGENKITKIGHFLRKTRIDELPQLWNVLKGELSLIGPRPEIPHLALVYEKKIPHYSVRHLIKPGLSGWAQLHQEAPPKFGTNPNDTKIKLAYDLYYIKNRSLILDIKIALKTIKVLLSRGGV